MYLKFILNNASLDKFDNYIQNLKNLIIYEITDNVRTRNVSDDIIVDSFIREYNKLINTHPNVRIDLYKYNDKRISYALTMT